MPYTTPNTVTGSDVLTAALWNTQIRDNLEWLRKPQNAMVYLQSTQPALSNGNTISWNAAAWDSSTSPATWSSSDPTKLYVRESGIYTLGGTMRMTTTASHTEPSVPTISITRSINLLAMLVHPTVGATTSWVCNFSITVQLTAGESVYVSIGLPSGGTATMGAASSIVTSQLQTTSRFTLTQVGVY